MTDENKMKAGVALALGVLAEAEADVVYFQPNLDASGEGLFGTSIKIDPFNQAANIAPADGSLMINYWCWGIYLQGYDQTDESGNVGEFLSASASLNDTVSSADDFTDYFWTSQREATPVEYYWGFRVSNTNSPTVYNYGYVHLSAYYQDNMCYLTLHDAAYESEAGTPITVGAVPEPATGSLIIMSILLIGVFRKLKFRIYGNR